MSTYQHFTYKWQPQPYKSWKNYKNDIVPSKARPITNGSWINNQVGGPIISDGNAFLPRPLKHWRKQLNPDYIRGGTQSKDISALELPGSVIALGSGLSKGDTINCCGPSSVCVDPENCYKATNTKIVSNTNVDKYNNFCDSIGNCDNVVTQNDVINKCWNGPIGKRICCNPEANLIKESQCTPIEGNFTDTSAYLQSRCKKYYQRLSSQHANGVKYFTSSPTYYSDLSGVALYPNNNQDGPQVSQKTSCIITCKLNQNNIYKPSNRPFSVEGAVSGGSRILKLKNDSFYQNGAQSNNANGLKATNYGDYNWEGNGSYFIKTKPTTPQCFATAYNHTRCFYTPTGNIVNPKGRLRGYR